jgi:hypothetical protein
MHSIKIFSGNEIEAGAVQQVLNLNKIGTWVKNNSQSPVLGNDRTAAVEIYIEADLEERARAAIASETFKKDFTHFN